MSSHWLAIKIGRDMSSVENEYQIFCELNTEKTNYIITYKYFGFKATIMLLSLPSRV